MASKLAGTELALCPTCKEKIETAFFGKYDLRPKNTVCNESCQECRKTRYCTRYVLVPTENNK